MLGYLFEGMLGWTMVQVKGSFDIDDIKTLHLEGSIFIPELPEYKGSTVYTVTGEMELPIELEMLIKYPEIR